MTESDIILDEIEEEGRLVTLAEVKEMLLKAQKQREELAYEQKIALEHAIRFARIDAKTAKKIVDDVLKAFPQLEPKFAYRIADLVPQHPDDVQAIFLKSRHDLSDDDHEKIVAIVDKHYVA